MLSTYNFGSIVWWVTKNDFTTPWKQLDKEFSAIWSVNLSIWKSHIDGSHENLSPKWSVHFEVPYAVDHVRAGKRWGEPTRVTFIDKPALEPHTSFIPNFCKFLPIINHENLMNKYYFSQATQGQIKGFRKLCEIKIFRRKSDKPK